MIRSNVERTFFGLLSELPPEQQQLLERQAKPSHYASARDAKLLGWTPLEDAVGLRNSVRLIVGGDDPFVSLMRQWSVLSINRPPFNVLTDAILRIYDRAPVPLLRAYSRVWSTIYRNVSGYAVEREGEHDALVVLEGACEEARSPTFRLYNLGVLQAVVEIGGGTKVHGTQRVAGDRVEIELHWQTG